MCIYCGSLCAHADTMCKHLCASVLIVLAEVGSSDVQDLLVFPPVLSGPERDMEAAEWKYF